MKLQRNELRDTRKEFEIQNATLSKQQFESTYFQMVNLFTSIVKNTKYMNVSGSESFYNISVEYKQYVEKYLMNENSKLSAEEEIFNPELIKEMSDVDLTLSQKMFSLLYASNKDILGHYFRTLYHIIKLIDNTENINKDFYISIIRAQLSDSERTLLFYNCLHRNGNQKFKPLVEKYHLFKNFDLSGLVNTELTKHYETSAFMK